MYVCIYTPLEVRFFMFQWNNGQGNGIRMLASPALHFPRPFGYSIEPKPSELPKLSLSEALFLSLQYYILGIFIGLFSSCVRPIGLLHFTPSMAIGRMHFCVFNICHSLCLTDELQKQRNRS